jgi:cytidylate kinase
MDERAPVIAIDGPSASGKGTVAQMVAKALGFHYLDSGALYRVLALAALERGVHWDSEEALSGLARESDIGFQGDEVFLEGQGVTDKIRSETCSRGASIVAAIGRVRSALLDRQRAFRHPPGLVAEGRDIGTVVFPDADLKIFLTASVESRAKRRHKQLKQKGIAATLPVLLQELRERDERDMGRSVAPLKPSSEARWLDTTELSAKQAAERVLTWYRGTKQVTKGF